MIKSTPKKLKTKEFFHHRDTEGTENDIFIKSRGADFIKPLACGAERRARNAGY